MKLLFFLINMNLGGTEKSFLNLLESLPEEAEVDLLLLKEEGQLIPSIPPNIKVKIIDNPSYINEFIHLGSRRFAAAQFKKGNYRLAFQSATQFLLEKAGLVNNPYWAIHSWVKPLAEKYDIAVAYAGIHNFIAWYLLTKVEAQKKVLWVHFDIEKVTNDFRFGQHWYAKFDQLFCVSENAKKVFQKRFPKSKPKTYTFNNIISTEQLHQQAAKGNTFSDGFNDIRIVTLGRLSREKGQQLIPPVVAKLKAEGLNFRWYLIGEGNLKAELQNQITEKGLSEYLMLLGNQLNPYAYLKDCDLYVQTSFYEGDPVALKEAKAFNKPVVATHFSTVSDLIENEQNGLIVEISAEGLYKGVKQLLLDNALLKKLSKPAIEGTDKQEMLNLLLKIQ